MLTYRDKGNAYQMTRISCRLTYLKSTSSGHVWCGQKRTSVTADVFFGMHRHNAPNFLALCTLSQGGPGQKQPVLNAQQSRRCRGCTVSITTPGSMSRMLRNKHQTSGNRPTWRACVTVFYTHREKPVSKIRFSPLYP